MQRPLGGEQRRFAVTADDQIAAQVRLVPDQFVGLQRVHPLPYRGGRLIAVFGLALALTLLTQGRMPAGPVGVAMKGMAVATFAILCARLELWKERGGVAPSYLGADGAARADEQGGA